VVLHHHDHDVVEREGLVHLTRRSAGKGKAVGLPDVSAPVMLRPGDRECRPRRGGERQSADTGGAEKVAASEVARGHGAGDRGRRAPAGRRLAVNGS
jgi:hypothetical protein